MFTLTLDLGNAAMQDDSAVADILRSVARRVADGEKGGVVSDLNGNMVGTFGLTREGC